MRQEAHREKALRIERSLARIADSEYETVIEAAMLAGTQWFNLLLHRKALRSEERDAMHAEFMTLGERRRVAIAMTEALAAMDRIEELRTTHVRGDLPDGISAAKTARACLAILHAAAENEMQESKT
jgi:hypothetical protein